MEVPRKIWEGRAALLRKAKDGKLSFAEFNALDMHKETKNLLKREGGLSVEGYTTLNAIEMYLKENS